MSEKIKRYDIMALLSDPIVGSPHSYTKTTERSTGNWCRSADVAALEAENARLRRIVEAAELLRDPAEVHAQRLRGDANPKLNIWGDRILYACHAYDAAKQPPAKGEK